MIPASRRLMLGWEHETALAIAGFRSDAGQALVEPDYQELINQLLEGSSEFAAMWTRQDVRGRQELEAAPAPGAWPPGSRVHDLSYRGVADPASVPLHAGRRASRHEIAGSCTRETAAYVHRLALSDQPSHLLPQRRCPLVRRSPPGFQLALLLSDGLRATPPPAAAARGGRPASWQPPWLAGDTGQRPPVELQPAPPCLPWLTNLTSIALPAASCEPSRRIPA
jgi:MmyB-like transcription regulator ligand binding domain